MKKYTIFYYITDKKQDKLVFVENSFNIDKTFQRHSDNLKGLPTSFTNNYDKLFYKYLKTNKIKLKDLKIASEESKYSKQDNLFEVYNPIININDKADYCLIYYYLHDNNSKKKDLLYLEIVSDSVQQLNDHIREYNKFLRSKIIINTKYEFFYNYLKVMKIDKFTSDLLEFKSKKLQDFNPTDENVNELLDSYIESNLPLCNKLSVLGSQFKLFKEFQEAIIESHSIKSKYNDDNYIKYKTEMIKKLGSKILFN